MAKIGAIWKIGLDQIHSQLFTSSILWYSFGFNQHHINQLPTLTLTCTVSLKQDADMFCADELDHSNRVKRNHRVQTT